MNDTDWGTVLAILGMTVVTVVTRGFFFISEREWRLPPWAQRGLRYAPIAALAAVIAPDIVPDLVRVGGAGEGFWRSAHLWAALAAAAFYFWRRRAGFALPLTIAVGMAVYLPLRLGLGW